jgi:hypothetical protein
MQSKGKRPKVASKLIMAAVAVAALAIVIDSLPDIKRYLEIRQM